MFDTLRRDIAWWWDTPYRLARQMCHCKAIYTCCECGEVFPAETDWPVCDRCFHTVWNEDEHSFRNRMHILRSMLNPYSESCQWELHWRGFRAFWDVLRAIASILFDHQLNPNDPQYYKYDEICAISDEDPRRWTSVHIHYHWWKLGYYFVHDCADTW